MVLRNEEKGLFPNMLEVSVPFKWKEQLPSAMCLRFNTAQAAKDATGVCLRSHSRDVAAIADHVSIFYSAIKDFNLMTRHR